MFIGHFAVGLALKRVAPRTSMGHLIAATQLADMLWPIFLLLGWEHVRIDPGNTAVTPLAFDSYPFSHSLLMLGVWAIFFAWLAARGNRRAMIWIGAAVISHWVLDVVTHRPDMPIWPFGGPKLGFALWNSVPATVVIEGLMSIGAVWIYVKTTRAKDGIGRWAFVSWVTVLALIYAGNLAGPPPPDVRSLALVALGLWMFPVWAWWFDAHRAVR